MTTVLVCGGRNYHNRYVIFATLNNLHTQTPITLLLHGDSPGADWEAQRWAQQHGIKEIPFPANWKEFGRAAGPIRNAQMLEDGKPTLVVAFPGGRGTANMTRQARAANIQVLSIKESPT